MLEKPCAPLKYDEGTKKSKFQIQKFFHQDFSNHFGKHSLQQDPEICFQSFANFVGRSVEVLATLLFIDQDIQLFLQTIP